MPHLWLIIVGDRRHHKLYLTSLFTGCTHIAASALQSSQRNLQTSFAARTSQVVFAFLAMIFRQICVWLLYLFCLGVQGESACDYKDEQLVTNLFDQDQLYGKWYLIMVAANTPDGLEESRNADSALFTFKKRKYQKVLVAADIRSSE
uniref:Uncharacterized protein n=1 Tax=Callorhinchus milii TaxID=7868 RepID=A0A4W3GWS0_CALMI